MPAQVTNYQCPACTGPLHFVGASGKLQCDYCGSVYNIADIEALMAEKDAKASDAFQKENAKNKQDNKNNNNGDNWDTSGLNQDWNEDGLHSYNCPSCGAELICDASTAATSCP